ncbi:MAG: hypothetical protein ISQ06_13375 [Planctomycetaceae bacterium]|nr:hypothetical protein [Planctomycetaceae bacterium]
MNHSSGYRVSVSICTQIRHEKDGRCHTGLIEQLADRLFSVEQSLTDANIRLKRHALAIEAAGMKKREHEKETINQQRVAEWLSYPARESTLQTPATDEQPFGNGGDPFSGSFSFRNNCGDEPFVKPIRSTHHVENRIGSLSPRLDCDQFHRFRALFGFRYRKLAQELAE